MMAKGHVVQLKATSKGSEAVTKSRMKRKPDLLQVVQVASGRLARGAMAWAVRESERLEPWGLRYQIPLGSSFSCFGP